MAGRGPQTFKKRQKEQARKERQEEKRAKRLERSQGIQPPESADDNLDQYTGGPYEPWPETEAENGNGDKPLSDAARANAVQ
jgi:hypothetical protein